MAPSALAAPEELATETIKIRHRTITLRELEIGEYDEIEKQSTDEITSDDGVKTTKFDDRRQQRLMLMKAIVKSDPELPEGGITKLGTRAVIALNTVVNRLNYGEVDPTTGLPGALYTETKNGKKPEKAKAGE